MTVFCKKKLKISRTEEWISIKFNTNKANKYHLVCVKFYLIRYRVVVAVAKCLWGRAFVDTVYFASQVKQRICHFV